MHLSFYALSSVVFIFGNSSPKKRHAKASIIVAVLAFILCGAFAPTTKTEADSSEAQASLSSKKKADEAKKRSESIASSAKAESKRKAREKKAASEKKTSEEAESNKAASESIAQAQASSESLARAESERVAKEEASRASESAKVQAQAESESVAAAQTAADQSSTVEPAASNGGGHPVNNGDMNTADANAQGVIVGNANSIIYHVPGQRGYRMNSSNAVYFNTEAEAQAAGYRKAYK